MNSKSSICTRPFARLLTAFSLLIGEMALASPGAHGPNGEHLDTSPSGVPSKTSAPRLEAKSELFELVAQLGGGELSILIDRYDTNEPVLKANVEVESGQLKATAKFHEDLGDYAVDDPAMLKLLSTPGEHPLVITVLAGQNSDLLDGVLQVGVTPEQDSKHEHSHDAAHAPHWERWALGALVVLAAVLSWRWRSHVKPSASTREVNGGQA